MQRDKPTIRDEDRIDISQEYAVCAWARHFNVSERKVREAVSAVGDKALRVREHLGVGASPKRESASERPSSR